MLQYPRKVEKDGEHNSNLGGKMALVARQQRRLD
jgi:hypothetical protein